MSYEVQFQHEGAEYTVRGPDIDGVLRLIQGVQAIKKPADDGWVEWSGGACPVSPDTRLEVVLRNGVVSSMSACYVDWAHHGRPSDIMRYRVCE